MNEVWVAVPDWEDEYQVSSEGRVRSLERWVDGRWNTAHTKRARVFVPERILKLHPWGRRREYLHVDLRRDGDFQRVAVHVLVLTAFVGPRPDGMVACHNNGNGKDNRLENLRWDTESANVQDSIRHGTHKETRKTCCHRGHEFTPENTRICSTTGTRYCRACVRIRAKESRDRRLAATRR